MTDEEMSPMMNLKEVPMKPVEQKRQFNLDRSMDNLVGAICDPIIVYPGGWATKDFIPEWLRSRITLDRMIELMVASKEGRDPTATDSEALAYMMPRTMEAPLDYGWTQIYLYLGTKVIESEPSKKTKMPADVRVDKLERQWEEDLKHLKRWLFDAKVKHRTEKFREVRKESKRKEEEAAPEVIQHAFKFD